MITGRTMSRLVLLLIYLGAASLAGCGNAGRQTTTATATTQITYHLDSSISRRCTWANNGPATCQVYVTNKPDSNFTFEWQGVSDPVGASFNPDAGSIAPGQTSGQIIVIADSTICPITFRFVDVQHQIESDSVFNACTGG